jgi:putative flippase GtrA
LKEFLLFGFVSAGTLCFDVLVYTALAGLKIPVFLANVTSSTLAALLVYLASTKYAFMRKPTMVKGTIVVSWYLLATLIWSTTIQLLVLGPVPNAIIAKLATVPISFGLNFLVTKFVITRSGSRSEGAA